MAKTALSTCEFAKLYDEASKSGAHLHAQLPVGLDETLSVDSVDLISLGEGEAKKRGLSILLYTGKPVARWGTRMVFDLQGMTIPNRQVPVLFSHDPERPIGFSAKRPSTKDGLRVEAAMLKNADATFVQDQADQGLKWQASMGVRLTEVRYLEEGEAREVNGADFKGPGYVVSKSTLLEASVLTLGADGDTQSTVLRLAQGDGAAPPITRSSPMKVSLKEFLAAFPQARRGWAAEQFAELDLGDDATVAQAVASVKAKLADELLKERAGVDQELADAKKRLDVLGSEGLRDEDTPGFSGAEGGGVDTGKVDLEAYDREALEAMPRGDLCKLLEPEWTRMSASDKSAFGADIKNFSAYRRNAALGRVKIRMGTPAVS